MPLCRECTFFLPDLDSRDPYNGARCENPATSYVDPVSGATKLTYCGVERSAFTTKCGIEGKLFIQRDPIQDAPDATVGATAMGG